MGWTKPYSHPLPPTPTHSHLLPSNSIHSHLLSSTPIHSHPSQSTPIYSHPLPPTPTHSHSIAAHYHLSPLFLAHYHLFSARFYPLSLMFSLFLLNLIPLPFMYSFSHPFPVHIQTVDIIFLQLYFFPLKLP